MTLISAVRKMVNNHYQALAAANCNTCHVGAWVIGREDHMLNNSGGYSMKALLNRFGGEKRPPQAAAPVTEEKAQCTCQTEECKILVVCKGSTFSREISDYAVSMAKKTRSSLVALSLDESGSDFGTFSARARESVEYFSAKADNEGLTFRHEVRQGSEETVVGELYEAEQFRYVMDDSAAVCKNRSSIPVYTRATLRAK